MSFCRIFIQFSGVQELAGPRVNDVRSGLNDEEKQEAVAMMGRGKTLHLQHQCMHGLNGFREPFCDKVRLCREPFFGGSCLDQFIEFKKLGDDIMLGAY